MPLVGSDRSTAPYFSIRTFLHTTIAIRSQHCWSIRPYTSRRAGPYALGVALEVITGLMHHRPAKPSKCVSLKLDSAEVSDLSLAHSSDDQCNEGHDIYRQGIGQRA